MSFVSVEFLVLCSAVCLLYPHLGHRQQNALLLLASVVFYGWWDWRFLGLLAGVSAVNYAGGRLADPAGRWAARSARRRAALIIALAASFGLLALFKYAEFFAVSINNGAQLVGLEPFVPVLQLVLPVGISFYIFQAVGYTIDVYRGALRAESHPLDFALYVSFFPQLVAGPIERAGHLLPQIRQARPRPRFWSGVRLALVGFFKKMVIADTLTNFVDAIFLLEHPTGPQTLLAMYGFAVQIYCDFSGYTDIARGVGRMLGFDLCENFRLPYLARNPADFWRRWHISLSTWMRDYLYIPLGGNRHGTGRLYRNLAVTMLLAGLWHGAAWHFVVWGAYHGLLLIGHRVLFRSRPVETSPKGLQHWLAVFGFFHLTCLGWLLFRTPSLQGFTWMIQGLGTWSTSSPLPSQFQVGELAFIGLGLLGFQLYQERCGRMEPWEAWGRGPRAAFFTVLIAAILLLSEPAPQPFIYFQF